MFRKLSLTLGSALLTHMLCKKIKKKQQKNITVFLHGYLGTYNSFGSLLNRFEYKYVWGEKTAIYYVSSQDDLEVVRVKKTKRQNEFIQVIFSDHHGSFYEYAKWLSLVMRQLSKNYPGAIFNLVGHSMGGIASLKYLQDYADTKNYPHVSKLVTLGSPFNGISNATYFKQHEVSSAIIDLKSESKAIQILKNNKPNHPKSTSILNVGSSGDESVSPESVLAIHDMIYTEKLTQYIINRKELTHSGLHEDEEVDYLINSFML